MSKWLRLIALSLIIGCVKAQHVMRLVLLAALGLAGLWMLYTLAQDFNKIYSTIQQHQQQQTPATNPKLLFVKRSINASHYYHISEPVGIPEPQIDWERILLRDPVGCARSFVCQLMATDPQELPHEESNILVLIRSSSKRGNWASKQLQSALRYGQQVASPSQCRNVYKFCPYSSKTMMSLLRLFGAT